MTSVDWPRYAILAKIGKVRVLAYVGVDLFDVLDRADHVRRVTRDRLTFIANKPRKV